jgi:hypothetical protein
MAVIGVCGGLEISMNALQHRELLDLMFVSIDPDVPKADFKSLCLRGMFDVAFGLQDCWVGDYIARS